MISIIPTHITNFRAFGWVQDPSNLRSLCDVVAIFDKNSKKHNQLVTNTIPKLVEKRDGCQEMLNALASNPLKISYSLLVGSSFTPRSSSRCNGIIQATVKGQTREYIGDWPADNFIRWAQCFGFVKYNYLDDTFEITDNGLALTAAKTNDNDLSESEKALLIDAALAYPPTTRILSLLSERNAHLTKFEMGKELGFIGEAGFTNMPQYLLIQALSETDNTKERNSIRADWEGSSDKYARMIASWLEKLGLVRKSPKTVTVHIAGQDYTDIIGQSYMITANGLTALRKAQGKSRHPRIAKNVSWEMLATKGCDREYIRTRRAYELKYLTEHNHNVNMEEIVAYLLSVQLTETLDTVKDDIIGLTRIGIDITINNGTCKLNDKINDFVIPLSQELTKTGLSEIKETIRAKLNTLSHEYLSLIDLAYDSTQNRLFEMKTLELLTTECEYQGLHLGGSRKPDGIIYTSDMKRNYGVIIDTKAYSNGYNLPISQADEMERYIGENQTRDEFINPNKWWENFEPNVDTFYFMFVSGHFKGNFKSQLERISRNKGVNGAAVAITNLLMCAEGYKKGAITHSSIGDSMFLNDEFIL